MEKEVELLERVLLRFAMAEEGEQLEKAVSTFLVLTIDKLASPHEATRNKVLSVLTHINKRVKAQQSVKLPLAGLLEQYLSLETPQIVKNINIIYLEMAFERSLPQEQNQFAPALLTSLGSRPEKHQYILLRLFLMALKVLVIPEKPEDRSRSFSFVQDLSTVALLLEFLADTLLLIPPAAASESGEVPNPGLSSTGVKRIIGTKPFKSQELLDCKSAVLKFLSSGLFAEGQILLHYIISSCDAHHSIISTGEEGLRKMAKVKLEDKVLVDKMFALFQGTLAADKDTPKESRRPPVGPVLKERLLVFMSKSELAANHFPNTLQVIFESIFGESSTTKVKIAGLLYVQWVFSKATEAQLRLVAPIILSSLLKILNSFVESEYTHADTSRLKGLTYTTIASLAQRKPELFQQDLAVFKLLSAAISTEKEAVKSFVQEALGTLTHAYYAAPEETLVALKALLLENVEKPQPEARLVAVQYANRLFPFSDITARYICILLASDSKSEIKEEAQRGLQPFVRVDHNTIPDPTAPYVFFPSAVLYLRDKAKARMARKNERTVLPWQSDSYEEALAFLVNCLRANAKQYVSQTGLSVDSLVQHYLSLLIAKKLAPTTSLSADSMAALEAPELVLASYRELVETGIGLKSSSGLHHVAAKAMLSWMYYFPEEMGKLYCTQTEWLQSLLSYALHESREICAKLLAYAVSWRFAEKGDGEAFFLEKEKFVPLIEVLIAQLDSAKETNVDMNEGASNGLGYIYARCLQSSGGVLPDYIAAYQRVATERLCGLVSHRNLSVAAAAIRALGNMARFGPLTIPDGDMEIDTPSEKGESSAPNFTKKTLVAKLASMLKSPTSERRLTERIAVALGNLCLGEPRSSVISTIRDLMLGMDIHKNDEFHFTIGEVLSCIGAGNLSTAAYNPLAPEEEHTGFDDSETEERKPEPMDTKEEGKGKEKEREKEDKESGESEESREAMRYILQKIFEKLVSSQATTRSSACIWLLSLVKHTGKHSVIRSNLATIQVAFSRLLSDNSEITQEVASRGLVLVYDLGDPVNRDDLVKDLVNTLSTGKTKKFTDVKVDNESEVLPEGALGAVPDNIGGGGLSTYKELCSVASELGQPDLIYKFMNMASHHSLWNSRKGAAFAAKTLTTKAGVEAIKPFLPVLVPKLYRYSHDPNPRLATSMKNILETLVGSRKMDDYFDLIMKELLEGMVSNVWRQRESSCLALSNLLQGRKWEQVAEYLADMWVRCFRTMDDIKESVRKAGKVASQSLSNLSLRLCDPSYTNPAAGQQAITIVLNFLLKEGLLTQAKEVRSFAVSELLKVCKVAGTLLRPHIPVVVHILLESLSALEPQAFNYLAFHVDKQSVLEDARLTVSKLSLLNDTLELCIKHVDESNIGELSTELCQLIQKGVGMPTKCGAAHYIVSLTQLRPIELKPHIPSLLKALKSSLKDKSPAVRTAYAQAIASLTKWATERSMKSLMEYLWKLYTEPDADEISRSTTGYTLLMTARASSVLKDYYKILIPLVLLARNDISEEIGKIFKAVWDECGIVSGLLLYLKEVVDAVQTVLGSKSWNLKMQGAKTLRDVSLTVGSGFSPYLSTVLPLLVNGLSGRTWKGKEALLIALAAVCKSCHDETMKPENQSFASPLKLTQLVLAECQRKDKEYKRHALDALISLLSTYPHVRLELFKEVHTSLLDTAMGKKDEEEEEEEVPKGEVGQDIPIKKENPQILVLKAKAFEAIGQCWPEGDKEWQRQHVSSILRLLLEYLPQNVWNVQVGILAALSLLVERLHTPANNEDSLLDSEAVETTLKSLWNTITAAKYSDVRKASLEVLMALIKKTKGTTLLQPHLAWIKEELDKAASDTNIVPLIKQIQAELR